MPARPAPWWRAPALATTTRLRAQEAKTMFPSSTEELMRLSRAQDLTDQLPVREQVLRSEETTARRVAKRQRRPPKRQRPTQKATPLPHSHCRWDPKANHGAGGWVAYMPVAVPEKVKLTPVERAAMRMHMPTPSLRHTKPVNGKLDQEKIQQVVAKTTERLRAAGVPLRDIAAAARTATKIAVSQAARQLRLDTLRPRVEHLAGTPEERRKARNQRKARHRKLAAA